MNFNYPYSSFSTLMSNPVVAPSNQIPFKPIAAERVSDIIGIAYNISSMDNVSVLPAPRPNEQQIFFIGNDDKIYSRTVAFHDYLIEQRDQLEFCITHFKP